MAKGKTKWVEVTGFLEWANIFPENMDDSEFHKITQGQFNVNFYPETEEELERLIDAGFPTESMGNKMIRDNPEFGHGIGKYVKLKRPNVHRKIEDFGGAPGVFDLNSSPPTKWTFEDGELGNGTKAKVKVSIFGEGSTAAVRLEKVGILERVEYVPPEYDPESW